MNYTHINGHDRGLIALAIRNTSGIAERRDEAARLAQYVRIDHFKLELPKARFFGPGEWPGMRADICNTLRMGNHSDVFEGEPWPNYSGLSFNNNDWHLTSPGLRLTHIYQGNRDNRINTVFAKLILDLNLTRFLAHVCCPDDNVFVLPEIIREGDPVELMRKHAVSLNALTLDDSDNILLGERYIGATATLACLRSYLEKTLTLCEQAFNQSHAEEYLRNRIGKDNTVHRDMLTNNETLAFVDRRDFLIRDAEFYIDFQHKDAIEQVKRMGKVVERIGRQIRRDEYMDSRPYYTMTDEGHCYSYRAALNNERELKIYAKTSTRIRIEICFKGSLRKHVERIRNASPLHDMLQLFERGIASAAADIASFLSEVSKHQPNRQYTHRTTPLIFSRFMSAMSAATDGDETTMQKIIAELLDRESVRVGKDAVYNRALRNLEGAGILKRVGIEQRRTTPVYMLTDDYRPILFHMVEPVGKLKLVRKREKLVSEHS